MTIYWLNQNYKWDILFKYILPYFRGKEGSLQGYRKQSQQYNV
jgi:hypothetical protein